MTNDKDIAARVLAGEWTPNDARLMADLSRLVKSDGFCFPGATVPLDAPPAPAEGPTDDE